MPIKKKDQKTYGKAVGANINKGKSPAEAKAIAEKAVVSKTKKK